MTPLGGTASARWTARWVAAAMMLLASGVLAAGTEASPPKPASSGSRTGAVAAGSAVAAPTPPAAGQSGLYEDEPIRRTVAPPGAGGGPGVPASPTVNGPWSLSRVPAALAAVLIVIFGIRWMIGKMSGGTGRGRPTRAMQVLARSTLSPRQQLMLIQIGKRLVLVGNSGGSMNPLCQIDDPTEVASLLGQIRAEQSSTPVSSFKSFFGRANNDYEAAPTPSMFKVRERDAEPGDREPAEERRERSAAADLLEQREMRDEVAFSDARDQPQKSLQVADAETVPNSTPDTADGTDPAVAATREELTELMAKVRRMSQGFPR